MSANIGWLFYRDYYEGALTKRDASDSGQKSYFEGKNELITDATLPNELTSLLKLPDHEHNLSFSLKTTYPGMLIGMGYTHETKMMGEVKIGFFFDHTTGLPVLPSSSVKGILRSAFPGKPDRQPTREQQRLREQKEKFLRAQLARADVADATTIDLNALDAEIFDGVRNGQAVSLPQRDIFGDAYPSAADNKLLGTDFITPHGEDLTKNPTPIQVLRVLPGVTFTFQFRLTEKGLITKEQKANLFRQILLHLGAGAKTNVGYGRFETEPDPNATYYEPRKGLGLLPNLQPKVRDNPPLRPVKFSDIVPPPRKNYFSEVDASKYEVIEERHYFKANPVSGVLLEAVARKNPANQKQKYFKLFIGTPGQEYEVALSYFDDSIVGKPCLVEVKLVDRQRNRVQTIEFKAVL